MRNVPIERAPAAESALRELAYTRHSSTAGGLLETEALLGLARGIATDVPALIAPRNAAHAPQQVARTSLLPALQRWRGRCQQLGEKPNLPIPPTPAMTPPPCLPFSPFDHLIRIECKQFVLGVGLGLHTKGAGAMSKTATKPRL